MSDTLSDLIYFAAYQNLGYCNYQYAKPVVATRQVSFTGSGVNLSQTFTYNTIFAPDGQSWTSKTTQVTTNDPLLGQEQTTYTYGAITVATTPYPQFVPSVYLQVPVESQIQYYDWGNTTTPTLTVNKNWRDTSQLISEFKTLNDGSVSGSFYQYSYGQVSDHREYGFGQLSTSNCISGTLPATPTPARETVGTFQSFTGPAYVAYGLTFGRPTSIVTYGNGTSVAETDYAYDGAPVSSVTATQHDDLNFDTSFNVRGNPTRSVSEYSTVSH